MRYAKPIDAIPENTEGSYPYESMQHTYRTLLEDIIILNKDIIIENGIYL
jgi:hypothetical protein